MRVLRKSGWRSLVGPAGPIGSTELLVIQAVLSNENNGEREIEITSPVIFNVVLNKQNPDISYDNQTGIFTIDQTGQCNNYLINCWGKAESTLSMPIRFALRFDQTFYPIESPWGESEVNLPDVNIQAQRTIIGFRNAN